MTMWLVRLDRGMEALERVVLALGIIGLAAVSIANVVGRNLFQHSLSFTEEVSQILVITITFVGIGYAARRGRHIRMSAFYDLLHGRARKALAFTITAGTATLLFALAAYSVGYLIDTYAIGRVTPALRIPFYLIYIPVPVGLVLGGLQYLTAAWRNLVEEGAHLAQSQAPGEDAHC